MRKDPLVNGEVYHIISRSIAVYKIFTDSISYRRTINALQFYNLPDNQIKFSKFELLSTKNQTKIIDQHQDERLTDIISFCLMPTHFHLTLKQNTDNSISIFMNNLLNSYTRYFNTRFKRKGPLWETRFKNILIESDEQLLHLTRYIHLNPVSAGIVENPEDWQWSSYHEYINGEEKICIYKDIINVSAHDYKKFVMDRKDYQKELSKIKALLIDDYTG